MTTSANLIQIPVGSSTETFSPSFSQPAKVLPFPVSVEMYRDGEETAQVLCDSFLGMCDGCGTPAYASDSPRVVDGYISCPTCVAEESAWKKVSRPVVFAEAA